MKKIKYKGYGLKGVVAKELLPITKRTAQDVINKLADGDVLELRGVITENLDFSRTDLKDIKIYGDATIVAPYNTIGLEAGQTSLEIEGITILARSRSNALHVSGGNISLVNTRIGYFQKDAILPEDRYGTLVGNGNNISTSNSEIDGYAALFSNDTRMSDSKVMNGKLIGHNVYISRSKVENITFEADNKGMVNDSIIFNNKFLGGEWTLTNPVFDGNLSSMFGVTLLHVNVNLVVKNPIFTDKFIQNNNAFIYIKAGHLSIENARIPEFKTHNRVTLNVSAIDSLIDYQDKSYWDKVEG